jgi:glycosyltransferase 2 family protein
MSGSTGARRRETAVAAIGLLISAVSLIFVGRSVDIGATGRLIAAAALGPLAVALCLYLSSLALRFLIWETLLPPRADGSRVRASRLAPVLMVGLLGNAVLPARLGEVIRAYLISRRETISFSGALGSVALERVVDTATLAVMAFVAAVTAGAAIWIVRGTGFLAVAGIVLLVALATTGLRPFLNILARLRAIRVMERPITLVYARLEWFVHWSGGAHRRRAMGIALCLSSAAWLCNAAMFMMVGQAVGAPISPSGALLVMAVTVLATAIPSAPAYVGTFELAAVTVAVSLGMPADSALAMAVLSHAMGLLPTAIGGSASLAYLGGGLRVLSSSAVSEGRMNADNSRNSAVD